MTREDKQKIAEQIAEKAMSAKNVTYAVVLQAVHEALDARDEEVERLQRRTKQLRAELEEAKNPWRTPLKELPEIGEMVLAITAGGSQTVLRYDGLYFTRTFGMNITMKDGGNTEIKYEQNFRSVLAWMPIPEGGEG